MPELQRSWTMHTKKSEILVFLAMVLSGLYAVLFLQMGFVTEAILVLLALYPAILSFYVLFRVTKTFETIGKVKHVASYPIFIVGISYLLVFYIISLAKYSLFPPRNFWEETFFFLKVVPTAFSFGFFMGGLAAKLLKLKHGEPYFMASGAAGVLSTAFDTMGIVSAGPQPRSLGLSTTTFLGLVIGFVVCVVFVVAIKKNRHFMEAQIQKKQPR